jgi:uncharacterized membrane protein (UPF0127 family)
MKARTRVFIVGAVLLALGLVGSGLWAAAPKQGELIIEAASGAHRFTIELATSPEDRAQGLMFRQELAPDAGMLFLYAADQPITMWMKNTLIPLDMLFIAGDGRILNIAERTIPGSLAAIPSAGPARGVLEVNGGTAARLGIKPGDRVVYPAFTAN